MKRRYRYNLVAGLEDREVGFLQSFQMTYTPKSIFKSVSFANDLLVCLEIFPAFIRVYVAVIAVILSPEIRGERSGDTSLKGDTSFPSSVQCPVSWFLLSSVFVTLMSRDLSPFRDLSPKCHPFQPSVSLALRVKGDR